MIPPLFSHKRYVRSALAYSRRHSGLRTDHRHYHVWQKLKETNLDQAYPLLATLYSDTLGCLGRDPVSMLRSCLAMMLCHVTSFDVWVPMMRDDPFYALISGFHPEDVPGVGKTMLAVGLGRAAVEAGHRTYYTTAAELAARCHRAAIEGRWATTMRFHAGPHLLIIDELGFDKLERREYPDASSLLYKVVDARNQKASTALVTNIKFEDWTDYLDDPPLAMALLQAAADRGQPHGHSAPAAWAGR